MRRLALSFLLAFAALTGAAHAATPAARWDVAAKQVMERYRLPGATLSVAVNGRVVLERAYGLADVATRTPARIDSTFRLASVSKPITAVAVAQAIARRRLTVATQPFARTPVLDPRMAGVTVAQLLQHRGGWDIDQLGYDPIFRPDVATCPDVIAFMATQPLSFAPGAREAYSNFGFCALADAVAKASRTSWDASLRQLVLAPLKMRATTLSSADPAARGTNEVTYYSQDEQVDRPYALSLGAADGAARVVSTAPDLQRFLVAVTGRRPRTARLATKAYGVFPPPARPGVSWAFNGSLPGTSTTIGVEGPVTYVFLTNSRDPHDPPDFAPLREAARATR